jgi:hypothetical protein
MIFATLATVEKGSIQDADRAMKGLSILSEGNANALMLYTAARYAERKGMYIAIPQYSIEVNGVKTNEMTAKNWKDSYGGRGFENVFDAKSSENGKVAIAVRATGDVPVYTTITSFNYSPKKQDIGQGKRAPFVLARTIKDANSKSDVTELTKGNSGIVTLTSSIPAQKIGKQQFDPYAFLAIEPIRPDYIYLNQESYNSPQYHSILNELFPGTEQYAYSFVPPLTYSDQIVAYDNVPRTDSSAIMPYVVYRSAGGSYYQPRAALVYTRLGVIVSE